MVYSPVENKSGEANDVVVDARKDIYVTGWANDSGDNRFVTASWELDADFRWVNLYDANATSADNTVSMGNAIALEVNSDGEAVWVYSAGTFEGLSGDPDSDPGYGIIKYNPASGARSDWPGESPDNATGVRRYTAASGVAHEAFAIFVAGRGDVYVCGASTTSGGSVDYRTLLLDENGDRPWSGTGIVNGAIGYDKNGAFDGAYAIAVSCAGVVHVTGESVNSNADFGTVLYEQAVNTANPSSLSIVNGTLLSGGSGSLSADDGSYAKIQRGSFSGPTFPPIILDLVGTASSANPAEMCFVLDSQVSNDGIQRDVHFWDYEKDEWVLADSRVGSTSDETIYVVPVGNPADYIKDADNEVKVRVTCKFVGPFQPNSWELWLDFAEWRFLTP